MKQAALIALILALGACASTDPATLAYPSHSQLRVKQEEQRERAERLQEDFNRTFPDG